MKKVLYSLLIIACMVVTIGCGKKDTMVGNYTLVEMKQGEVTISKELLKTAKIEYTIKVNKDNTAIVKDNGGTQKVTYDDKYFYPDSDKNNKNEYTYKKGKITVKSADTTMIFEKK